MTTTLCKDREGDGFILSSDLLGELATLTIDLQLFDKAAIFKAAYWATGKAFLYFLPIKTEGNYKFLQIEVRPKIIGKETAEELAREISNSLIDYQTRQFVIKETSAMRDALLQHAFAQGHKHIDPETL